MERFASLKFKVTQTKDRLDKAFPELFRLQEFQNLKAKNDWEKLVKYICLLYDPGCELAQEFQDLQERKEAAAIESRYERDKLGNWPPELIDAMEIKDREIHAAIMAFLKIFRNHEWMDIIVTEQEMYERQALRLWAISNVGKDIYGDAKKKDELMESVSTRRANLKVLKAQFYGDHKDVEKAEFDEMITPENAERILATMTPPWEEIREEATNVLS